MYIIDVFRAVVGLCHARVGFTLFSQSKELVLTYLLVLYDGGANFSHNCYSDV